MKTIILIIAFALSLGAKAQITKVSLQASGLTCSMCSNSINKALKTLDFVEGIDADVKTYTFEITFKANSSIDFDKVKKKVENAGFTVSGFVATVHFNNVEVKNNQPVTIAGQSFLFVNVKDQFVNGVKRVKILDKGFVPVKEFKSYDFSVSSPGTYHATI